YVAEHGALAGREGRRAALAAGKRVSEILAQRGAVAPVEKSAEPLEKPRPPLVRRDGSTRSVLAFFGLAGFTAGFLNHGDMRAVGHGPSSRCRQQLCIR